MRVVDKQLSAIMHSLISFRVVRCECVVEEQQHAECVRVFIVECFAIDSHKVFVESF